MDSVLEKRKILKEKLKKRQQIYGGWTSLAHPSITEILCASGIEFLGIDLEHSTISQEQSQRIIAACNAAGVVCLPRIASHNKEMARRILDSGADGLIVPMVNNPDDVHAMIEWVKYPPVGKRGFGVSRAQGYGVDFAEYTSTWNESSILIAQIESIDAVNGIDEILKINELDGVMVGPYDISGSLKIPGQIDHPKVVEAGLRVVEACRKMGKACGNQLVEPNLQNMKEAQAKGYTFTILSSDVFILWKWAAARRNDIAGL